MKFLNKLITQQQCKYRIILRKLIYRPRTGILRAKWLEELESKEELKVTTRFAKKDIGECY
jgi:hypothetical protein